MAKTIENLFYYLVFVFDIIIIAQIFLFSAKNRFPKIFWLVLFYCFLNSSVNYTTPLLQSQTLDYLLGIIFTVIEYLIFAYFIFFHTINRNFHKFVLCSGILFVAFVISHYSFGAKQSLDSIPIAVETILIFIYSFYYFYEQLNKFETSLIYNKYHFWIIVGMLIYLGGSFFIYVFTNQIVQTNKTLLDQYWFLTYVFYIIKNILFFIGIAIGVRQLSKTSLKEHYPKLT